MIIEHAAEDARFCEHPGLRLIGVQRYIGVPIRRRDGRFFGTLCALDPSPGNLPRSVLRQFELLSELIAHQLEEQDLNAERERFMGVLAHDLRNPLNAIGFAASALAATPAAAPPVILAGIHRSVSRMGKLIDDLTDFTRGRIGERVALRRAPVAVEDLLRGLAAELANVGAARIEFEVRGDVGVAQWDAARIGQLFSNLFANALTHSPAGSKVDVTIRGLAADLEIAVANGGAPIPAELMPMLFEPFCRGNREAPTASLGLGLYIAERIATAHGGSIAVTSTQAEGTRFTVRLPRQPSVS